MDGQKLLLGWLFVCCTPMLSWAQTSGGFYHFQSGFGGAGFQTWSSRSTFSTGGQVTWYSPLDGYASGRATGLPWRGERLQAAGYSRYRTTNPTIPTQSLQFASSSTRQFGPTSSQHRVSRSRRVGQLPTSTYLARSSVGRYSLPPLGRQKSTTIGPTNPTFSFPPNNAPIQSVSALWLPTGRGGYFYRAQTNP